jgi:mono/diheme cytochrome c family protein
MVKGGARQLVVCLVAVIVLVATTAVAALGGSTGAEAKVIGNVAAGKKVFTSVGCAGCHTLKAAKATGMVGPNLDKLKPPYAKIVKQVTNGGGGMPAFKGRLSKKQIQNVAAFVYTSTHK